MRAFLGGLDLQLKARATILAPCAQGLPFLGWRVYRGLLRLRPENLRRTRARVRQRERQHARGLLDEERLAGCVRSVVAHLRAGNTSALRRSWFAAAGQREAGASPRLCEPRQPRRQLRQRRPQRAVREPQQERADGPQQRPRRPSRQGVTPPPDAAVAGLPAPPRSAP